MSTENLIPVSWISVSVFYGKNCWKQFLAGYLKPYLSAQRENGNIGSVYIAFSEDQGAHIELVFECFTADQAEFTAGLKTGLTDYLKLNPSGDRPENYKGKEFFMDFPNDQVRMDPFHQDIEVLTPQLLLSERILNVFAEEEVDDSSVISFVLYMIMAFCSTWQEVYNEKVCTKLLEFLNTSDEGFKKADHLFDTYHELFDANKELITDMYHEVSCSRTESRASMDLWPLKEYYRRFLSKNTLIRKHTLCMPLDKIVVRQLDRDPVLLPYIYYLVYLCLESGKEIS